MQFKKISKKIGHIPNFKMMPTIFLSLLLIVTVAFLTGMCAIFPKKNIEVYDDGVMVCRLHTVNSNYDEIIDDVLFSYKNKPLEKKDYYTVREEDELCEIYINRGFDLEVKLPERVENVEVLKGSKVSDVLKDLKIEQNEDLYVTPDLETVVEPNTKIDVVKVERKYRDVNRISLPFEKKYVLDKSLKKGERKLKQKGVAGEKETYVEEIYSNGNLIKTEKKEIIVKPAVEEIILVGNIDGKIENSKNQDKKDNDNKENKAVQSEKNNVIMIDGKPVKFKKKMVGAVTAYSATLGNTSRMGPARKGVVATNPKVLPYNTKLFIPGYGYAVVGDYCPAACKGRVLVDVCFSSEKECRAWGRKTVPVYILE